MIIHLKSNIGYALGLNIKLINAFKKQIKKSVVEEFIKTQPLDKPQQIKDVEIKIKVLNNQQVPPRGLNGQKPIPISATLGPIKVENPKISTKKYRWCACGMSLTQPFCDDSHKGTDFLPVRFSIEEPVKFINLCGCKYTKTAPFCDGQTCKLILNKEASEPLKIDLESKSSQVVESQDQSSIKINKQ